MKKTKKKKWVRLRHKIITNLAHFVIAPFLIIKYGIKAIKFKDRKKQYFIVSNHQTALDQFFVEMVFRKTVYYVASEDIFSKGFISALLKWALNPIPIKKQSTDILAIKTILQVVKEGGSVAIFPEGNRTFSGKTEYFNPAIIGLIRKSRIPVAVMNITGGYGVQPRWTDKPRKGKINAFVKRVIEPEEYNKLSDDELYALLKTELYVNEAVDNLTYKSKRCAEYLERLIYVCPECGLSHFSSDKNTLTCLNCGFSVGYAENKTFYPVNGNMPFKYVNDWYTYQQEYISNVDLTAFNDTPAYVDNAKFSLNVPYQKKVLLSENAEISLYGNKILVKTETDTYEFLFDDTSVVTVLGRNKLNVYYKENVYQFKGDKSFNPIKYMHFYYHYQNVKKGVKDEFFGI
ncbi:MAG: 1-acyl-sn-glycerol-3-phosphate acyltransferase [Clostridia bacterium]|nr:1-acyl-sn-glycerol-3-phosphate acyltransferase [Clostridia bacterium]